MRTPEEDRDDLWNLLRAATVKAGGEIQIERDEFIGSLERPLEIIKRPDRLYIRSWPK